VRETDRVRLMNTGDIPIVTESARLPVRPIAIDCVCQADSHLFKRYQKRSLWRMFGKLLSAQDKKVI
jgi:hypothetical protein